MKKEIDRIIVKNVSKKFNIGFRKNQGILSRLLSFISGVESKREIQVLDNVSFKVSRGEVVGIIGPNGVGKSSLLRVIAGIYKPDFGYVKFNGKIISLINLGIGFQNRLSMRDNIYLCCALFDLGIEEINSKLDSIIKFAELEQFVDTKLYQFSSGMQQRLAFSIAIHCNPEILLLDEVFEVGDEDFRKKSSKKIKELVKGGVSVILVSHDMEQIRAHCDRTILIQKDKIVIDNNFRAISRYLKRRA